MSRRSLIDRVFNIIEIQRANQNNDCQSIYLAGCRGSGKTSLLMLIAQYLKGKKYEVYYFKSPRLMTNEIDNALVVKLKELEKDRNDNKLVAILIDEAADDPSNVAYITLLKSRYPYLVTIGAAVPRYLQSGITGYFRKVLGMSDLILSETDADFVELIAYCAKRGVTTAQMTDYICKIILQYCGGHIYPTVAIIEAYFSMESLRNFTKDEEAFGKHFFGPSIDREQFYMDALDRCFPGYDNQLTLATADAVLSGRGSDFDVDSLVRIGWWNDKHNTLISNFAYNALLGNRNITIPGIEKKTLKTEETPEKNAEEVIIAGFKSMDENDFTCLHNQGYPVENSLSYSWLNAQQLHSRTYS